jgi:hypothetical protein
MTTNKPIFATLLVALLCLPHVGDAAAESQRRAPGQTESRTWLEPAPQSDRSSDEGISSGRIVGEILAGSVAGIGGALVGGLAGMALEDCEGGGGEFCGLAGGLVGGYVGYSTGVAFGVYRVGTGGDHEASLGATMGGSFLGGLGAIVVAVASDGDGAILLPIAPLAGALIGLHATSTRRRPDHESTPVLGSLINVDEGEARLGLPMLSVVSTPQSEGHATLLQLAGGHL